MFMTAFATQYLSNIISKAGSFFLFFKLLVSNETVMVSQKVNETLSYFSKNYMRINYLQ